MPALDTYYQLIERDKNQVSYLWKALHISALSVAVFSGLTSAIFFCIIISGFSNNCILNPTIYFKKLQNIHRRSIRFPKNTTINIRQTVWSPDLECQFCVTSWMLGSIFATMLLIVFIVTSRGGKDRCKGDLITQPWKLIYPSLFISLFFSCAMGLSAFKTLQGLWKFCAEFEPVLDTKRCTSGIDVYTRLFVGRQYRVADYIRVVNACSFTSLCAWLFFIITLVSRICIAPDFMLLVIYIKTPELLEKGVRIEEEEYDERFSDAQSEPFKESSRELTTYETVKLSIYYLLVGIARKLGLIK